MRYWLLLLLMPFGNLYAQENETSVLLREAEALVEKLSYAEALVPLNKLLQKHPEHTDALEYRRYIHGQLKNYDAALADVRSLIGLHPGKSIYRNNAGWYFLLTGRYDSAKLYCTRAIDLNPFDYNNYLNLGHAYAMLEDPAKSVYYYKYAADYMPVNEEHKDGPISDLALFKSMGVYPYDTGSIAAMFRQTYSIFESNTAANKVLDSIYKLSFYSSWTEPVMLRLLNKFIEEEEKNQYWRYAVLSRFNWNLGLVAFENRNTVKAINQYFARSFALMSEMQDTLGMISRLIHAASFWKDAAVPNLQFDINLSAASGENHYLAEAYRELADYYTGKYNWDSGMLYARLLTATGVTLQQDKYLLQGWSRLRNCLSVFKKHDSAFYYHNQCLSLLVGSKAGAAELFGFEKDYVVLLHKAGLYKQSIDHAEKTYKRFRAPGGPDLSELHELTGINYYKLKNYREAEAAFLRGLNEYKAYAKGKSGQDGYQLLSTRHIEGIAFLKEITRNQGNPEKMFALSEETKANLLYMRLSNSLYPEKTVGMKELQAALKDDEAVISFSSSGRLRFGYAVAFDKRSSVVMPETEENFDEKMMQPLVAKQVDLIKNFSISINPSNKNRTTELKEAAMVFLPLFHVGDLGKVKALNRGSIEEETGNGDQAELSKLMNDVFYELYIRPFENILKGKRKIYISTELATSYLPFEALQNKKGEYLGELYNIVYVPSFTVAGLLQQNKKITGRGFLAVGNPLYSKFKATEMNGRAFDLAEMGLKNWSDLPGTGEELLALQQQVEGAVLVQEGAVHETAIKDLSAKGGLKKYDYIHFALHGMTRIGAPDDISLILTEPAGTSSDGFLQFWEIADLDLDAKLVCISACATATGTPQGNEDMNIATALFLAGARAVLAAAWSIDDAATALFMKEFYHQQFTNNKTVSEALHITRQKFIKGAFGEQYRSPYYWAAFKLSGID